MSATNIYPDQRTSPDDFARTLPSGLNILTILTFIGSALGLIFTMFLPNLNKFMMGMLDKASNSGQDLTATQLADIERGKTAIELSQANMLPLMITGFIGIALCVWGAIWMRKLKKDGYWIYVAGELMPLVVGFILLGTAQFNGAFSIIIAVGIPVLFIILYTLQRKHLVN